MNTVGSLHILRLDENNKVYTASFAPYQGSSGFLTGQEICGEEPLRHVLTRFGIHADAINDAIRILAQRGEVSLPNVIVSNANS
jgi:hypothetical protein